MSIQNVVLIGPPGSGKTSVGKILAEQTGRRFFDTDHLIEQRHGMTVAEIFSGRGEAYFRKLESDLLDEMAASDSAWQNLVLGTGGGIIVTEPNLQKLQRIGLVVCLIAPVRCLLDRLKSDNTRPLLASQDEGSKEKRMIDLLVARESKYRGARYAIETAELAPQEVAIAIQKLLCMSDNTGTEASSGIECGNE